MEEFATAHIILHDVTVLLREPVDPTARTKVNTTVYIHGSSSWMLSHPMHTSLVFDMQWRAPQPVGMEEHATLTLPLLTVTVPVGTRDPTVKIAVCVWMYIYILYYIKLYRKLHEYNDIIM